MKIHLLVLDGTFSKLQYKSLAISDMGGHMLAEYLASSTNPGDQTSTKTTGHALRYHFTGLVVRNCQAASLKRASLLHNNSEAPSEPIQ